MPIELLRYNFSVSNLKLLPYSYSSYHYTEVFLHWCPQCPHCPGAAKAVVTLTDVMCGHAHPKEDLHHDGIPPSSCHMQGCSASLMTGLTVYILLLTMCQGQVHARHVALADGGEESRGWGEARGERGNHLLPHILGHYVLLLVLSAAARPWLTCRQYSWFPDTVIHLVAWSGHG